MPELDDDKTDKLFQVGADRHDFEYDPAAWQQMEVLLDADDLVRKRRMWLAGGGVLLLFLLGLAWFMYQPAALSENIPADSPQVQSEIGNNPVNQAETDLEERSAELAAANSVAESAGSADPAVAAAAPAAAERAATPQIPSAVAEATAATATEATDQTTGSRDLGNTSPPVTAGNDFSTTEAETVAETPAISETEPEATQILAAPLAPVPANLGIDQLSRASSAGLTYERALPAIEVAPDLTAPTFTTSAPKPGLAVGVSVGAVSGMTSLDTPGPVDIRIGGTLDYRFSNKLSVGTGGYLSRVCYQTDGKNYKANEGFFEVIPKDVIADCDILEIPLNVTWHPAGSDRSGLYFGAGLSSYFMLTEKFDFKYDVEDDNLVRSWREDNTNRHLFGVSQFRFGYQRKASRRSAFQVESFLQLPLTGLGHGKVNFFSVGASVNYTFDFRKQR